MREKERREKKRRGEKRREEERKREERSGGERRGEEIIKKKLKVELSCKNKNKYKNKKILPFFSLTKVFSRVPETRLNNFE